MKSINKFSLYFFSNPHIQFIIIILPVVVTFIMTVPSGWGLDEQVHIARAYNISQGKLYPVSLGKKGHYGAKLPKTLVDNIKHGHFESNNVDRSAPFYKRQDIVDINKNRQLEGEKLNDNKFVEYDFGPTGIYTPLIYAPAAIGFFIAQHINLSVDDSVEIARILQAIFYCVLCFSALFVLRKHEIKWLVFIIALLPTSVFQASIITADTFTIAASLLFFSLLFKFLFDINFTASRRYTYALCITSVLMALTKPSYALLITSILFIDSKKLWSPYKISQLKYVIVGFSFIVFILVSLKGVSFSDSMIVYKDAVTAANISLSGQFVWILSNQLSFFGILARTLFDNSQIWFQSIIGLLGYNAVQTPFLLTMLILINIIFASFNAKVKNHKKAASIFFIVGLLSALTIILLLYVSFNTIGYNQILGVQGRYFIPVLPFIVFGLSQLLPIKLIINEKFSVILFSFISVVTLYITVLIYLVAMY